ncbi:hypothetical protein LSG31_10665 [Fodinisporobacter ferrooxydans]|uniref:Uncharacterized protein n=1 Tax=Fodinisporobacter ferrooxydans TaxID=2901836 RepID=A0ABY4CRG9_9BACL|nr:hypothetical protein LSG31_10665 [Alicyclobacillaceae bacterium MYW30-H2]
MYLGPKHLKLIVLLIQDSPYLAPSSSIKATFKTVPNYSGKLQTDTADPGPWTQSALLGVDGDGDGNWVSTTQWEYQDGVSYSKVEDQLNWTESNKGYSNQEAVGTLDQGSEASYGVVQVNTFSNSNMPYTTSTNGSSTWVQGYTDVFFQVSSSFSASYAGLSISVSSGGQWHQFAVTEAAYDGSVDYSQAQYT